MLKYGDYVLSVTPITRYGIPTIIVETWNGERRRFHEEPFPFPPYAFCHMEDFDVVDRALSKLNIAYDLKPMPKSECISVFGKPVAKLETIHPKNIGFIRDVLYRNLNIKLLEADVPYSKRVVIDLDLKPYPNQKPLYCDIEVDPRKHLFAPRESIIKIVKMQSKSVREKRYDPISRILSVAVCGENESPMWISHDDEIMIFRELYKILARYSMLITWTLFDLDYLRARARKLNVYNRMLDIANLDLMFAFWKAGGKHISAARFISLSNAAKTLNVEMADYECKTNPFKIWEYWEKDRKLLRDYNVQDVTTMIKINKKANITELHEQLMSRYGLMLEDSTENSVVFNTLVLKFLAKRKPRLVVPCRPSSFLNVEEMKKIREERYTGGFVFNPIPGRHYWVGVYDFKTMYPTIMRSFNIGLDTIDSNGEFIAIHNRYTNHPKSVMVEILDTFEDWKNELTKI